MKNKEVSNPVCAYRDCNKVSHRRLYFSLGFSALFCDVCAKNLVKNRLANESPLNSSQYNAEKKSATETVSTPTSIASAQCNSEVTKSHDY